MRKTIFIADDQVSIVCVQGRAALIVLGVIFFSITYIFISGYVTGEISVKALAYFSIFLIPLDVFVIIFLLMKIRVVISDDIAITKKYTFFNKTLREKDYEVCRYKKVILCKQANSDSDAVGFRNWLIVLDEKAAPYQEIKLCGFQSPEEIVVEGMKKIESITGIDFRDERDVVVGNHGPYFK